MRDFISNRLGRSVQDPRTSETGFTLIEMVVVIGIIVALAAVIVPLVVQFSGTGASAAQDAEWDAVQTSIDTMMADNEMTTVTASSTTVGTRVTDTGTHFDSTQTLVNYTRDVNTNYCYRWDSSGRLLFQYDLDAAGACTTIVVNP